MDTQRRPPTPPGRAEKAAWQRGLRDSLPGSLLWWQGLWLVRCPEQHRHEGAGSLFESPNEGRGAVKIRFGVWPPWGLSSLQ